jgi:hypothetical protein
MASSAIRTLLGMNDPGTLNGVGVATPGSDLRQLIYWTGGDNTVSAR